MPPSRLVLPPRLCGSIRRVLLRVRLRRLWLWWQARPVWRRSIADRARVLNARVTRGRFGTPYSHAERARLAAVRNIIFDNVGEHTYPAQSQKSPAPPRLLLRSPRMRKSPRMHRRSRPRRGNVILAARQAVDGLNHLADLPTGDRRQASRKGNDEWVSYSRSARRSAGTCRNRARR
jgi:hypothetical protein